MPKKINIDAEGEWHNTTLNLFINRPRILTVAEIAKATALPENWLNNFTRHEGPSVNRVQILHDFLTTYTPPTT